MLTKWWRRSQQRQFNTHTHNIAMYVQKRRRKIINLKSLNGKTVRWQIRLNCAIYRIVLFLTLSLAQSRYGGTFFPLNHVQVVLCQTCSNTYRHQPDDDDDSIILMANYSIDILLWIWSMKFRLWAKDTHDILWMAKVHISKSQWQNQVFVYNIFNYRFIYV